MKKFFALLALVTLLFSCTEDSSPEPEPSQNPQPDQEQVKEPAKEEDTKQEVGHNTEPYFSETVELMGLIFRLAGANEYCECPVYSVANSADRYFASMKNHIAVQLAKECRRTGVSHDAVTGYANQLILKNDGQIIYDPNYLDGSNQSFDRWSNQQKADMLVYVNNFYMMSNFHEWFESTQTEQQQAINAFKQVCNVDYEWYNSFFEKKEDIASRIILSFMIGNHNNGISLSRKDGTFLLTPVIGSFMQQIDGVIVYRGGLETIIHEFCHPYCNPLIDTHWSSIAHNATVVFNTVKKKMKDMAYGTAKIMMYETLVRACTIRYMLSHNMENEAFNRLAYDEGLGFILVRPVVEVLEKYKQEKDKYATLDDFMPEIIDVINNFDVYENK